MPTAFEVPANNIVANVGTGGYTALSGTLALAVGQGAKFPALTGRQFYRLTVVQQGHAYDPLMSGLQYTIYKASSLTGDTFSGVVSIEGTSDRNYVSGDVVDIRVTAGTIGDIQVAVNAAETLYASVCQGRLTLSSGNPIADVTNGATLYFTPFRGSNIGLFDGTSSWNLVPFVEQSLAVPVSIGIYDLFGFNNGGVLALETATWSSGTARATALVLQDGVLVKSGATTRRYLGTIYSQGNVTSNNPAMRFVWNYLNRTPRKVLYPFAILSWTNTAPNVWRPVANNAVNVISVVNGLVEFPITLRTSLNLQAPDVNNAGVVGIGYDTFTVNSADLDGITGFTPSFRDNASAFLDHLTGIGLHNYYALEQLINVGGTPSISFYSSGPGSFASCGITGTFWC